MNTACFDTLAPVAASTKVPRAQQMVLDALVVRKRHGVHAMTATEIRELLEEIHAPRRFDKGWVTGRLSDLKDSDLVEQMDETKVDPRTRKSSHLWRLAVVQARLCA
jgi:hypothetical protein